MVDFRFNVTQDQESEPGGERWVGWGNNTHTRLCVTTRAKI